jgi:hypothetical protein
MKLASKYERLSRRFFAACDGHLKRDLALRSFFGVYFFLSATQWAFDQPLFSKTWGVGFFVRYLSDDLSGRLDGNDVSFLAFDESWLRKSALRFVILGATAAGSVLVARRQWRAYGVAILLGCGQVLAYSVGRRIIKFDIIYIAFMGYGLGLALEQRFQKFPFKGMPWFASMACLYSVYTVAFFSKVMISGFHWASEIHLGQMLIYGRFRCEMGGYKCVSPDFLVSFFSHPTLWSTVFLSLALALEAVGLLVVLAGTYSWIFGWFMIATHLGMYIALTILFRSVVGLHFVFAVPWNFLGGVPAAFNERSTRFAAFAIGFVIVILCLSLPTSSRRNNVSLVWPFSSFNMFASPDKQFAAYYFRDHSGEIFSPTIIREEMRVSVGSMNSMLLGMFGAQKTSVKTANYVCEFVRGSAPAGGVLRSGGLVVWTREFYLAKGTWFTQDQKLRDCGSLP